MRSWSWSRPATLRSRDLEREVCLSSLMALSRECERDLCHPLDRDLGPVSPNTVGNLSSAGQRNAPSAGGSLPALISVDGSSDLAPTCTTSSRSLTKFKVSPNPKDGRTMRFARKPVMILA